MFILSDVVQYRVNTELPAVMSIMNKDTEDYVILRREQYAVQSRES